MAWEIAGAVPADEPRRPIYIVSNDTLVESPLVIRHLRRSLDVIREAVRETGLPITIKVTEPCIDQTFWVTVIGRGYIPPTRNFRWCTDRMKIAPANDLIHKLVLAHERAILLVGTRKSESQNRGRAMTERGVTATTMNPHSTIPNCRMFAPLLRGRTAGAARERRRGARDAAGMSDGIRRTRTTWRKPSWPGTLRA